MAIAKQTTATVIPALQYQDAPAAIDFLCKAFGFEKKAVYEGEGGSIAHAELTLGNGMVMLGSAKETDYGKLLARPGDFGGVTMSTYCIVADPDAHSRARRPRAPRSRTRRRRRTTAGATTPARTLRATCGASAPTIPGSIPSVGWAFPPGTSPCRRGNHIPSWGVLFQGRLTRWRSARIPTGSPARAGERFSRVPAYPLHRDDAATVRPELAD